MQETRNDNLSEKIKSELFELYYEFGGKKHFQSNYTTGVLLMAEKYGAEKVFDIAGWDEIELVSDVMSSITYSFSRGEISKETYNDISNLYLSRIQEELSYQRRDKIGCDSYHGLDTATMEAYLNTFCITVLDDRWKNIMTAELEYFYNRDIDLMKNNENLTGSSYHFADLCNSYDRLLSKFEGVPGNSTHFCQLGASVKEENKKNVMEKQLSAVQSVFVDFMQKTKNRLTVVEKLLNNERPSMELIDAEYNDPSFPKTYFNCERDLDALPTLIITNEDIENNPDFEKKQIAEYIEAKDKLFENYQENLINEICLRSQIYLYPDDHLQEYIKECDERMLIEREM